LNNISYRKYCFPNLTQFSQQYSVLHAPPSNTNGFLLRYKGFYNSAERADSIYLILEKPKLQELFLSKSYSILTGKNVLDALGSSTCVFSSIEISFSST
jgi:hypothetical protein